MMVCGSKGHVKLSLDYGWPIRLPPCGMNARQRRNERRWRKRVCWPADGMRYIVVQTAVSVSDSCIVEAKFI